MAAKSKVDLSKMSPEDRQKYEERKAKQNAPKPLYIGYVVKGPDGTVIDNATIDVKTITRKAEEILKAVDDDRNMKYERTEVK